MMSCQFLTHNYPTTSISHMNFCYDAFSGFWSRLRLWNMQRRTELQWSVWCLITHTLINSCFSETLSFSACSRTLSHRTLITHTHTHTWCLLISGWRLERGFPQTEAGLYTHTHTQINSSVTGTYSQNQCQITNNQLELYCFYEKRLCLCVCVCVSQVVYMCVFLCLWEWLRVYEWVCVFEWESVCVLYSLKLMF